jgi:hypothetical protein
VKFDDWMMEVDSELSSICGLQSADLADQTFHCWYVDGLTPRAAAIATLRNEWFPF